MSRRTELSMGCSVETPTCSICGEDCAHSAPIVRYDEISTGPTFLSASLVEVRCDECDYVMEPLGTFGHWACTHEPCALLGKSINNGIGALRESA